MRHLTKLSLFISAGLLAVSLLAASAQAQGAKIAKVIGKADAATLTRNGTQMPVTEGMAVQVGDVIKTGADVDVFLQPYSGVLATIKPNSVGKVESLEAKNALLDMTGGGTVLAQIEPKKGNAFGVRTPKGVAAARGTVYNVTVAGQNYTVVTMAGAVSVFSGTLSTAQANAAQAGDNTAGGAAVNSVTVGNGQAVVVNAAAGALPQTLTSTDPVAAGVIQAAAQIAVAAVAQVAQQNIGGQGSNATAELSAVVAQAVTSAPTAVAAITATAAKAAPEQAAAIVKAAVDAAPAGQAAAVAAQATQGATQGVVQAANGQATAAVTAQVQAIAQTASQTAASKPGADAVAVAQSVATAAAAGATQGITASGGSVTSGTAAQTLTSAAATGSAQGATTSAPTQAQAIANSSASGAVQGATNSGAGSSVSASTTGSAAATGAAAAPNAAPVTTPVVTTPVTTQPATTTTPVVDPSTLTVSPSGT